MNGFTIRRRYRNATLMTREPFGMASLVFSPPILLQLIRVGWDSPTARARDADLRQGVPWENLPSPSSAIRNHFGRQVESFETNLNLSFIDQPSQPFNGIFIRAPVFEKILSSKQGEQVEEDAKPETVVAPSRAPRDDIAARQIQSEVDIMAVLPGRTKMGNVPKDVQENCEGDIIAVRQGNVFGTSFHPELTEDIRIHVWWLRSVLASLQN